MQTTQHYEPATGRYRLEGGTLADKLAVVRGRVRQHHTRVASQMLADLIKAVRRGDIDELATDYELEKRERTPA